MEDDLSRIRSGQTAQMLKKRLDTERDRAAALAKAGTPDHGLARSVVNLEACLTEILKPATVQGFSSLLARYLDDTRAAVRRGEPRCLIDGRKAERNDEPGGMSSGRQGSGAPAEMADELDRKILHGNTGSSAHTTVRVVPD